MRWHFAAALGILGFTASGADRETRHFLAISATSYNATTGAAPGEILLYDRESATEYARFDFPGTAYAPAVTPDGAGLYVVLGGRQPGLAVVDLTTLAVRSFLPVNAGGFTLADARILMRNATGIVAVDLAGTRVLATAPCPAPPQSLVYDGVTGYAYAAMAGRQDLCVVTPDLDPATPLPTPIGTHEIIDSLVLVDRNLLLVTTYAGGVGPYKTFAVDATTGASTPVPSLDGVYPSSVAPDDPTILYGFAPDGFRAYRLTFGSDGGPVFTSDAIRPRGFADDRYVYTSVAGSCSTPEGPVTCAVGFRMLDRSTLAEIHSVILAQQTSFGLFAPRSINLTLSAVRPFGSSVSPPRHSRR